MTRHTQVLFYLSGDGAPVTPGLTILWGSPAGCWLLVGALPLCPVPSPPLQLEPLPQSSCSFMKQWHILSTRRHQQHPQYPISHVIYLHQETTIKSCLFLANNNKRINNSTTWLLCYFMAVIVIVREPMSWHFG